MAATVRARQAAIARWWARGFPGGFTASAASRSVEPRVRQAFARVLGKCSERECQRFLAARPTLVCEPDVRGAVIHYAVPTTVIYLSPTVRRLGDRALGNLVAHETAHVVLGHQRLRTGSRHTEGAADTLAMRWGFAPTYPRRVRRAKTRLERQAHGAHR